MSTSGVDMKDVSVVLLSSRSRAGLIPEKPVLQPVTCGGSLGKADFLTTSETEASLRYKVQERGCRNSGHFP